MSWVPPRSGAAKRPNSDGPLQSVRRSPPPQPPLADYAPSRLESCTNGFGSVPFGATRTKLRYQRKPLGRYPRGNIESMLAGRSSSDTPGLEGATLNCPCFAPETGT